MRAGASSLASCPPLFPFLCVIVMNELTKIHNQPNHVSQWRELKRLYTEKRGSDTVQGLTGLSQLYTSGQVRIPRTTNGDIAELTKWWHKEFSRGVMRDPWRRKPELLAWIDAKKTIERDIKGTSPAARYPKNEWFWQVATLHIAKHLEAMRAAPSADDLVMGAFKDLAKGAVGAVTGSGADLAKSAAGLAKGATSAVTDAADAITDAGKQAVSMLKTGALITAGVLGAVIVLPPVIRAMRKD
jgi:hypothetical protein